MKGQIIKAYNEVACKFRDECPKRFEAVDTYINFYKSCAPKAEHKVLKLIESEMNGVASCLYHGDRHHVYNLQDMIRKELARD